MFSFVKEDTNKEEIKQEKFCFFTQWTEIKQKDISLIIFKSYIKIITIMLSLNNLQGNAKTIWGPFSIKDHFWWFQCCLLSCYYLFAVCVAFHPKYYFSFIYVKFWIAPLIMLFIEQLADRFVVKWLNLAEIN